MKGGEREMIGFIMGLLVMWFIGSIYVWQQIYFDKYHNSEHKQPKAIPPLETLGPFVLGEIERDLKNEINHVKGQIQLDLCHIMTMVLEQQNEIKSLKLAFERRKYLWDKQRQEWVEPQDIDHKQCNVRR